MHDDGEEKAEVQSTVSSKSFSIANSIFKENKLTYDTFLGLLSDPTKDDTKQTHAKPQHRPKKLAKNDSSMQEEKPKKQNFMNLTFNEKVERINDIFIRIITARISPVNPDFDIETLVHTMVETSKYQAFKRLAAQTGDVIESRTTHQPELLAKLAQKGPGVNHEMFVFKCGQNNKIIVDESNGNSELAQNLFDNGLRIMMYDKIIKSGFSHLSIFLDDFNYIYNEVITSTNKMSYKDVKLDEINSKNNKSIFKANNAGVKFEQNNLEQQSIQSSSDITDGGSFMNCYQDIFGHIKNSTKDDDGNSTTNIFKDGTSIGTGGDPLNPFSMENIMKEFGNSAGKKTMSRFGFSRQGSI